MKIAVTGQAGQVVTSLIERGTAAGHDVIALGRPELDLADPTSVIRSLEATGADVIVSAAAYTAVLAGAGAFPRDSFDKRIVGEVQSRTGAIVHQAGPMPVLTSGTPYPDRDGDGMSDSWEIAQGTNPAVADSWGDRNGDGLSNLEAFLAYAHQRRMSGLPVI